MLDLEVSEMSKPLALHILRAVNGQALLLDARDRVGCLRFTWRPDDDI